MPYKKKTYKKKIVKRNKTMFKNEYKKRMMKRPVVLSGFPNQQLVKLRYVQQFSLNPTSGSTGGLVQQVFCANGCYDPDITGSGHQPMAFDQWMLNYDQYTVFGSQATLTWEPTTASAGVPGYFGILLSTSSSGVSAYSNIDNLMESKGTGKTVRIGGINNYNANGNPSQVVKNFSSKKFFGIARPQDGTAYSGTISANPVEQCYFICWMGNVAGNDPDAVYFKILIDYIVLFHDIKNLDGS